MRIFIVTFLSFILLVSGVVHAQNEVEAGQTKSLVMKTTNGKVFDLSQKKGKVVMIAFWASWCTICKIEMSHISDLYQKYNGQGLEIIGINVDGKLSWGKDLKYPVAMMDNYTVGDFGFPRSIPLVYIVNKDGVIAEKLARPEQIKADNLEDMVKNLLKETTVSPAAAQIPVSLAPSKEVEQTPIAKGSENNVSSEQQMSVPVGSGVEEKKVKFNFKKN